MDRFQARLDTAARRAMFARTRARRRVETAKAAARPSALVERGRTNVEQRIEDVAVDVRRTLHRQRWPIGIAVAAALAYVFRRPLIAAGAAIAEAAGPLVDQIDAALRGTDEVPAHDQPEQDKLAPLPSSKDEADEIDR